MLERIFVTSMVLAGTIFVTWFLAIQVRGLTSRRAGTAFRARGSELLVRPAARSRPQLRQCRLNMRDTCI